MTALYIILAIVVGFLCIAVNVFILLQKKRASGFGSAMSGMAESNTYWDKNKGRSREGRLEFYTKLSAAAFMLITLALNVLKI